MGETLKISFIVTYYNQKDFVSKSLESILAQDLDCEFEILIGDDGSTDGTLDIVQSYLSQYPDKIKLFVMPRAEGEKYNPIERASSNRINVLKHAQGEYFCILDGDDYYTNPHFASKALLILDSDRSLVACGFDFDMVFPDRVQKMSIHGRTEGYLLAKEYILSCWIPAAAIVFRNVALQQSHYHLLEESKNFDDNLITIFMLNFGSMYYHPENVFAYIQNSESIWNSMSEMEHYLVNAMDLESLMRVAPHYRKELLLRNGNAFKQAYKARAKLKDLLTPSLHQRYVNGNCALKNHYTATLLNWDKASWYRKLRVQLLYLRYKLLKRRSR